ncbi:Replicative DNA helicase [Pseudodesulfovibrio hydrargyri]|uniref:Replicative DNA helicase n=1 Tax=Pseudodesulfovibrio hydrargyri TaxID=2125990 RepID=A0A1J5MZ39_9BACT|nr:DnaB-like helicase C-terminal domain-containing protein [Pseudodesulfovibrio hydrargyri]OIQ51092.1 Replicative DNA helicase [Pseudodesulfovibrio hydrargyri]
MTITKEQTYTASQAIVKTLETIVQNFNIKANTGIPTHYHDFDMLMEGLQSGEVTVLAGRPSVGKTYFALNIALRSSIRSQIPIVIFAPSQSIDQITLRMCAIQSRIEYSRLQKGWLDDADWEKLYDATDIIQNSPIFIHDTPRLTLNTLSTQLIKSHSDTKAELYIIDYLQLIHPTTPRAPRDQEIADITREVKTLARELNVHIILISQLNRKVEERLDKRPMLADLRDSGAIEDDADNIVFLYRDALYNKSEDNPLKNHAEIIIAKHRNGTTGRGELFFKKEYGLFENMECSPIPQELSENTASGEE